MIGLGFPVSSNMRYSRRSGQASYNLQIGLAAGCVPDSGAHTGRHFAWTTAARSRRNLESYLFDDEVLRTLTARGVEKDKTDELLAEKQRILASGGPALEAGLSMAMAAAGTRGELVAGGSGGFALAFKADALWGRETMAGMAHGGVADGNRLNAEVGYGLPVGRRFVGTPRVGVSTSEYGHAYRLGYGLTVAQSGAMHVELGVNAHRRESPKQGGVDKGVLTGSRW